MSSNSCHTLEITDCMERIPFRATQAGAVYDGLALPVAILLDNVRSLYNVGAFFRTADAAGVERLFLCGITGRPPKRAISKTALGAEDTVENANFFHCSDSRFCQAHCCARPSSSEVRGSQWR